MFRGWTPPWSVKVITLNTADVRRPDDPSLQWKLEASFRHNDFLIVARTLRFGGTEELVVRASNKWALDYFIRKGKIRTHPRLLRMVVTGPGYNEEINQSQMRT